ncbi:MAG: Inosine-uridine preferring nucleoside hydrolase [Hydrocarboniphaga sp.]|uniref:nucleoside hydrolase n=1 Tax=Hydrocarboniphaga sp. TaxID=2033016 RepID=UPI00263838C8|nr:nucleoside hydrolase [Hydrocarboniphaga sp.]MDB5971570.1 Inosine-uridine preferring nucleoside hydrolase [Hydrocarboniphaga sp.]
MPSIPRFSLRALTALMLALCSVLPVSAADPPRRKIIIDQDAFGPASSNLQAILMLLQSPDVEVLGIVATSGDGWRDEELGHSLRLLEVAGRTEVPVYGGAVYPLVNTQARTKVWEQQYGALYYKGAWTESWPDQGAVRRTPYHADPFLVPPSPAGAPKLKAQSENGAAFMVRKVREFPGQVTIWTGGPLTTVALAARLDPAFAANAQQLVIMGASFNPQPADNDFAKEFVNSPRREFNMRWDPEAASLVLHEAWKKITVLPIDPTTKTFFKPEFFKQIARGKAPFASYLVQFGQSFPMWDELAAAVWLNPAIVTRSQQLLVDIDTSFTAGYGNTLSWSIGGGPGMGERAVTVVEDVDVPAFEKMTLDLLTRAKP